MRIKDGLSKISKAKGGLIKKHKKPMDNDTNMQLEASAKKLDILKHELHKCQIQLTALYTALAANEKAEAAAKKEATEEEDSSICDQSIKSVPRSRHSDIIRGNTLNENNDRSEVVKLSTVDPATKTDIVKTFALAKEETVRSLIGRAIEKFNLEDAEDDYQLIQKTEEYDVPLRMDDAVINEAFEYSIILRLVKKEADTTLNVWSFPPMLNIKY